MHVLFAPIPPASVRDLANELLPSELTLSFECEDKPEFEAEIARAQCLFGVPRGRIDAALLAKAPNLKFVQLLRKGVDKVDQPAMKDAGIGVATIGGLTAGAVAEHTLMLMLAVCRKLAWQHDAVTGGKWRHAKPWQLPGGTVDSVPEVSFMGLDGLTLGLYGMGGIGKRVAVLAQAFGMKVQAHTRTGVPGTSADGVKFVSFDDLLATSDVVSLHAALTPDNRNAFSAERFAQMKRGAVFINTARGQFVDEAALADALASGHLAGAGLDTMQKEPPPEDNALLSAPNVVFTPHTGWLSRNSWERTIKFGFENVQRFIAGGDVQFRVV